MSNHHAPPVVAIAVIAVTFAVTVAGLAYLVVGESTDQRLERDRAEAALKATQIHSAYVRYQGERGEWPASINGTLTPGRDGAPYLEGGRSALFDPWGKQFQGEMRADASGKPQPVVWTNDPRGQRVAFPAD